MFHSFSISGSDFVEMFVGVGASRVVLFLKMPKKAAPAIIFIDELMLLDVNVELVLAEEMTNVNKP